jgi:hypothetical protein
MVRYASGTIDYLPEVHSYVPGGAGKKIEYRQTNPPSEAAPAACELSHPLTTDCTAATGGKIATPHKRTETTPNCYRTAT